MVAGACRNVLYLTDSRAYLSRFRRARRRWSETERVEHVIELPAFPRLETDLVALADRLGEDLRARFAEGVGTRLVIPARWCLMHEVTMPAGRWDERAAAFAFEPFVPVELERLTWVCRHLTGRRAVVAAVFTEPFARFFEVLADAGIRIEWMTVDLFALSDLRMRQRNEPYGGLVVVDQRHVTVGGARTGDGVLSRVRSVQRPATGDIGRLGEELISTALLATKSGKLRVVKVSKESSLDDPTSTFMSAGLEVECTDPEKDVHEIIQACAEADALPDLRRGALSPRERWEPLLRLGRRCCWAAAALVLVLTIRLHVERSRYATAVGDLRSMRNAVFRDVFPDSQATPAAPLLLRSERIKLEGLTDGIKRAPMRHGPSGLAAFRLLSDLLSRIPPTMKLHLSEMSMVDDMIRLVGRTTSHSAAGDLVQSFNTTGRVAMDPPQTKLLKDGTVQFRAVGQRAVDD